jgi:hypothetical protein
VTFGYLAALRLRGVSADEVAQAISVLSDFVARAPVSRAIPADAMAAYAKAWAILVDYTACTCGPFPPTAGATIPEAVKAASELVQNAAAKASTPQSVPGDPIEASVSSGQSRQVTVSPTAPPDSTFVKAPALASSTAIPWWAWLALAIGLGAWAVRGEA